MEKNCYWWTLIYQSFWPVRKHCIYIVSTKRYFDSSSRDNFGLPVICTAEALKNHSQRTQGKKDGFFIVVLLILSLYYFVFSCAICKCCKFWYFLVLSLSCDIDEFPSPAFSVFEAHCQKLFALHGLALQNSRPSPTRSSVQTRPATSWRCPSLISSLANYLLFLPSMYGISSFRVSSSIGGKVTTSNA